MKHFLKLFIPILVIAAFVLIPGLCVTPARADGNHLEFEKKKYTFTEGDRQTLWVTYNDIEHFETYYWEDSVQYKSSNPKVVSIDRWGNIRCLKKGTATITAKYNGVEATCKVKVKACSYKLSCEEATLYTHQKLEVVMTGQSKISYYGYEVESDHGDMWGVSVYNHDDGSFTIESDVPGSFTVWLYAYKSNGSCAGKKLKLSISGAGFDSSSYCVAKDCTVQIKPDNAKLKSMEVIYWCNEEADTYFNIDSDPQYRKGYSWDDDDDPDEDEWNEREFAASYDGAVPEDIEEYYEDWDYNWEKYDHESWDEYIDQVYDDSYWVKKFWNNLWYAYDEEDLYSYVYYNDEYWADWEEDYYDDYWDEYEWLFSSQSEFEAFRRDNYAMFYESFSTARETHKTEMDSIVNGYLSNLSYYVESEKSSYKSLHWEDRIEWESRHSEFVSLKSLYDDQIREYNKKRDEAKAQFEKEKREREEARAKQKKEQAFTLENSYPFTVSAKGVLKGIADGYGTVRACYTVPSGEDITVELSIEVTNPTSLNFGDSLWVRDGFFMVSAEGASWDSSYSIVSDDESVVSTDPSKNKNSSNYNNYYDYYEESISERYVFPQKEGETTLTVTVDGKKLTQKVYVINPKIPDNDLILTNKKSKKRTVTNLPEGMTAKYSSSDKSVVTISKKGVVKAKKDGSANITVKVGDREFCYSVVVGFELPARAAAAANSVVGAKYSQDLRMQEGYYDCSSLVWRSYREAGVSLVSESYAPTAANLGKYMEENGYIISYEALDAEKMKPGDIIFSSSGTNGRYKNIDHVCMYFGNKVDDSGNIIGGRVVQAATGGVYVSDYLWSYPQSSLIVMIARLE